MPQRPADPVYEAGLREVCEAEQAARLVWWRRLDAAAGLVALRTPLGEPLVDPRVVSPVDWVLAEIGWACRSGPFVVARRVWQAELLGCHPRLREAVELGVTSPAHLDVVAEVLRPVDPGVHSTVLDRVLPVDLGSENWQWTPGELRRVLGQVVRRVDPEGVRARREAAARSSVGVRVRRLADGLATLSVTGQAVSVRAVAELVRGLAQVCPPGDDERSLPDQHVAVLLQALQAAVRSTGVTVPGLSGWAVELQLELPASTGEVRPTGSRTPPEPSVIESQLTPEAVGLLVDALARLELDVPVDPPAQLPLTGSRTDRARALLELLGTHPPPPPPMTERYRPTAAQTRLLRARDSHCCFPGCTRPARTSDLDHIVRHPDGATTVTNLQPLCEHHHRLKHAGAHVRRHPDGSSTWTSPHGQTRRSPPRHALVQQAR